MANNNKANASIQQYEPLRVPSSWDAQGKGFAVRLQDILDDIYKRFGRLSAMDFTPEVRQEIVSIPIISSTVTDIIGTPEKPGLIATTATSAANTAVINATPGIKESVQTSVLRVLPGQISAEVTSQTQGIAGTVESSVLQILPGQISAEVTSQTQGIAGTVESSVLQILPGQISAEVTSQTQGIAGTVESSVLQILPGQISAEVTSQTQGIAGAVESSVLQILPGQISATVNENGVTTSAVTLSNTGIGIKSTGSLTMNSNTAGTANSVVLDKNGVTLGSTGSLTMRSNTTGTANSVVLDKTGIALGSTGSFTVAAGGYVGIATADADASYINLGTTFSANATSGVQAKEASFGKLYVSGKEVIPNTNIDIKVASAKPSGSNFLWIKPASSSGSVKQVAYSKSISTRGQTELLNGTARSHVLTSSETLPSNSAPYSYEVSFMITNVGATTLSPTISASIGGVSLGTKTVSNMKQWDVRQVSFSLSSQSNVCTSGYVTLSINASNGNGYLYIDRNQTITLNARSTGSSVDGALPCETYWIP